MLHSEREEKEMLAVAKYEALAEHAQNLRLAALRMRERSNRTRSGCMIIR